MFSNPQKNVQAMEFKEGSIIADLGCGIGSITLELARSVGESGMIYSVDVQSELLSKLKNEASKNGFHNVHIIHGDIEVRGGTGLADGICDAVVLSNTLNQVEHKDAVLDEANRILKQGGILSVIDWVDSFGGLGPEEKSVISKDSMKQICESHGFVCNREYQAGDHHYGLIFKSK